ncbi:MAG: DsbA family oxidoreductase [Myxococcaceae bacterium]|nr:DsbA family oxidoreductase [Myxococcaceae bacterium]
MRINVWTDVVCPWCYVGKRRFERALAEFPHREQVQVVHHSFQLDPSMPRGKAVEQLGVLKSKYGLSEAQASAMMTNMERTAAAEGLEYHLAGGLVGNTSDAHRLLHLAKERGIQDAVVERFYRAHFTEQRSLFDHESLVQLADEAGLDADEARRVLKDDTYAGAVTADAREAQKLGATGVPFFVIDNRYGVAGAQPTEVFASVLARAWADAHPVSAPVAAPGANAAGAGPGEADACADGTCAPARPAHTDGT